MDKVRKAIPDGKAVHLPDDKEPKVCLTHIVACLLIFRSVGIRL